MKWLFLLLGVVVSCILQCHSALPRKISKPALLLSVPDTSFSCKGRPGGYYADIEANCQSYHMCDGNRKYSFLCPHLTFFHQKYMVCNHYSSVDCLQSEKYYELNLNIGKVDEKFMDFKKEDELFTNDINDISSSFKEKLSATKNEGKHVKRESFLTENSDNSLSAKLQKDIPIIEESHQFRKESVLTKTEEITTSHVITESFVEDNIPVTTIKTSPAGAFPNDHTPLSTEPPSIGIENDNIFNIPQLPNTETHFIAKDESVPEFTEKTSLLTPILEEPLIEFEHIFLINDLTTNSHIANFSKNDDVANTSPFTIEGMFEEIDENEFLEVETGRPVKTLPEKEASNAEIFIPETSISQIHDVDSEGILKFKTDGSTTKVNGRGGGKISFKKMLQKKLKPISQKVKSDSFVNELFISDDESLPLLISEDFDETPFGADSFQIIPTTLQPPPPSPPLVLKEISPPPVPPVSKVMNSHKFLPLPNSLVLSPSTELELPSLSPQDVLKPIHPLISQFLTPPAKGSLKLHGHYQEEDTPLTMSYLLFSDPKSPDVEKRHIRLGKHLPSLKGNPDFFIPQAGLVPPLPEESAEYSENSIPEDSRMTMRFLDRPMQTSSLWPVNYDCPRCHPAFLKPGQCTPCVIIR